MTNDDKARQPNESAMDTIHRVLSELGDDVDRIVIISLAPDGETLGIYSNARSEAEITGMLSIAQNTAYQAG